MSNFSFHTRCIIFQISVSCHFSRDRGKGTTSEQHDGRENIQEKSGPLPQQDLLLLRGPSLDLFRRKYKSLFEPISEVSLLFFSYSVCSLVNFQINKYSNQIARVFQEAGYVKGDAVALMMPNRPEYVAIWLGLGKLGVVTALINTNLRLQSLIHCLRIAEVKSIIYTEEYTSGKFNDHNSSQAAR